MRIGLSTYTYPWAVGVPCFEVPRKPLTPAALFEKARDDGIGVVQLCDNIPLHKIDWCELEKVSETAATMGIEIEIGTRGVEPVHLLKYLEIAKLMHSSMLRTMINPVDNVFPAVQEVAGWLKEVMSQFASAGVSIAIENTCYLKCCKRKGRIPMLFWNFGHLFPGMLKIQSGLKMNGYIKY